MNYFVMIGFCSFLKAPLADCSERGCDRPLGGMSGTRITLLIRDANNSQSELRLFGSGLSANPNKENP